MFKKLLSIFIAKPQNKERKASKLVNGKKGTAKKGDISMEKELETKKVDTETEAKENGGEKKVEKEKTEEVKKEDTTVEPKKEEAEEETETEEQPMVQNAEPQGNGIRVEDLVTKDELAERFAALEAKFDAVLKENADLKDKYEKGDFGNLSKQGVNNLSTPKKETFDDYNRNFNK